MSLGPSPIPCSRTRGGAALCLVLLLGLLASATSVPANNLTIHDVQLGCLFGNLDLYSNQGATVTPCGFFRNDTSLSIGLIVGPFPQPDYDILVAKFTLDGQPMILHPVDATPNTPTRFFPPEGYPGAGLAVTDPPLSLGIGFIVDPGRECCYQPKLLTMTFDLLNSSPDYVIPSGPSAGQMVDTFTFSLFVLEPAPEPAPLLLFGTTAAGLGLVGWRRRHSA